jgi:hypothetical protein
MSQSFSEQKEKLMQELPCTPAFAEGYLDGKVCRTHGRELSRSFRFCCRFSDRLLRTGLFGFHQIQARNCRDKLSLIGLGDLDI